MADGTLPTLMTTGQVPGPVKSDHSVVSFFCGCGGLDLGFIGGFTALGKHHPRQPSRLTAAYDFDEKSVATYRLNIGDHAHVADLSTADVTSMEAADVLIGGFPCQEFSYCGPRQGLRSERGQLYKAMVRYAKRHAPKVIVGENVAGLLRANDGKDLETILADFSNAGYRHVIWDMRADDYAIPQMRHRIFLIFVRKDLSGFPAKPLPAPSKVTVREVLSDLLTYPGRKLPNQDQYFKAQRAGKGHGQGDEKTPGDGSAYTVRANSRSRVQFHYSRPRRLTVRECARLQSFPDTFKFGHGATSNMSQIGNAVPPALAHLVAAAVFEFLNVHVNGKR